MLNTSIFDTPVMRPVARDDLIRQPLEQFIYNEYKKIFNAQLNSFLPNLVVSTTTDDDICAAFGYSDANQDRLFLESYLEQPIEIVISKKLGRKIQRDKIVEVGNLAITDMTDSVSFLRGIARYFQSLGYEWIVCTATRYLRLLFLRSGSKPFSIATASITKAQNNGTDWGNYYATTPEILVGNVNQSVSLIERKLAMTKSRKNHNVDCLSFAGSAL